MSRKVTFLLGAILLLTAAAPSFAQSHSMIVNVPFGFTVGQKTYPAGKYMVSACDSSTSSTMYRLSALSGKTSIAINAGGTVQSTDRFHPASLLFANLGGEYSLMQIWTGGRWGAELSTSSFKNKVIADGEKVNVVAQR
jgi:hypothetical protein